MRLVVFGLVADGQDDQVPVVQVIRQPGGGNQQAVAIAVLTFATLQAERLASRRVQQDPAKLAVVVGQPG